MLSFFGKLSSPVVTSQSTTEAAGDILARAEAKLQLLRTGSGQDFPLLNEATRLVQQVEGLVMRMPESDPMKGIWREQVGELQKALQTATTRMLSSETSPGTPPAAAQFAAAAGVGPVRTQPSQRQAMLGAGGSLFDGLSVDANPHAANEVQQNAAVPPIATATASQLATLTPPQSLTATLPLQPAQSGDGIPRGAGGIGGMFSGLDLVAEGTSADASAPPAAHLNRSSSAASSDTTAWEANGLRRSHISGRSLDPGSPASSTGVADRTFMPHAHVSTGDADSPGGAALQRKRRTGFRVGYARAADEKETNASVTPTSVTPGSSSGRAVASHMRAMPADGARPPVDVADGASAPERNDSSPSSTGAKQQSAEAAEALQRGLSVSHREGLPSSQLHQPTAGPVAALSATGPQHSTASTAAIASTPAEMEHAQEISAALELTLRHDAASSISADVHRDKGAPAAVKKAPVSGGMVPVASAPVNAFDEALGFRQNHLEAASISMFEAGLEGHVLPEKVAMVRQRLDLEQDRLAAGLRKAVEAEQSAKTRRQKLSKDCAGAREEQRALQQQEERAVDAEDFERAADLSARLDSLNASVSRLADDLRAAEAECELTSSLRVDAAAQQALAWERAATVLQRLAEAQRAKATQVLQRASQDQSAVVSETAEVAKRLQAESERDHELEQQLDEEARQIQGQAQAAAAPLAPQLEAAQKSKDALQEEVDLIRSQLAAKEQQLAAAAHDLEAVEREAASMASAYDDELAALGKQRSEMHRAQDERAAALEQLAARQLEASQAMSAAEAECEELGAEVEEAIEAAAGFTTKVAQIRCVISAQQAAQELIAELRSTELVASADLQSLEAQADAARSELREATARAAVLQVESADAHERATAARRRIPELEAKKKAAAASRDFKEAARLSAEAKALAAEAEAAHGRATAMSDESAELAARESVQREEVDLLDEALAEARRSLALAQWRRLQVIMTDVQRQLSAAITREAWEDAEALQQELTAAADQVAAASAAYAFQDSEAQDLLDRLQDTEPVVPPNPVHPASESPEAEVPLSVDDAGRSAGAAVSSGQPNGHDLQTQAAASDGYHSQVAVNARIAAKEKPTSTDALPGEDQLADELAGQSVGTAGLVSSASRAGMTEGYAGDSDSSMSVLKQSQSAASIADSAQLNLGEATAAAATAYAAGSAAADDLHPEAHAAGEGPAGGHGQHRDSSSAEFAGLHGRDETKQWVAEAAQSDSEAAHHLGHQAVLPQHNAAAGPDPSTATDVPDSRTESSADGLTPSVSRSHLAEGYAADSDTSVGGRKQHHVGSLPAGLHGSADVQRSRQLTVKGLSVSPIPETEGEQLPTGVPEELPPPAPPLGLEDRHESGNLADAEDEPPGEQTSAAPMPSIDDPRSQDAGGVTAEELPEVQHEVSVLPSGMFAGLELA